MQIEKLAIKEEERHHVKWFSEAEQCTMETLGEFVKGLVANYEHDYGTIVHAIAAAVGATITAMNKSEQGGITGFQAGCLMWEILEKEFGITYPAQLLRYKDLLYPQYEDKFTSISPDVWEWVRNEAKRLLAESTSAAENVKGHWEKTASGIVPFGLNVRVESK